MHGTRSQDFLKLNAKTLPCSPPRALGPKFVDLTDGADVGLREDAAMGTPRCDLQTFSQAIGDIPPESGPFIHPKARSSRNPGSPFYCCTSSLALAHEIQQQYAHETGYDTFLCKVQAPICPVFTFLSLKAGTRAILSHPRHDDI